MRQRAHPGSQRCNRNFRLVGEQRPDDHRTGVMAEFLVEEFLQLRRAAAPGFVARIERRVGLEALESLDDAGGIADRLSIEKQYR